MTRPTGDPLRHLTMRQLQIFRAVAQAGSFAEAARRLHLTHSAVSMQMSQLSELLGVTLFEQQGRARVLTGAGRTLWPFVEDVARTLAEARQALASLADPDAGP